MNNPTFTTQLHGEERELGLLLCFNSRQCSPSHTLSGIRRIGKIKPVGLDKKSLLIEIKYNNDDNNNIEREENKKKEINKPKRNK